MGIEDNKILTLRLYEEVINTGNLELADQFISEEAIENEEVNKSGLDSLKEFYTEFRAAFPDLTFTIEDLIAEGDKVVARMRVTGTHNGTGSFMGFEASDRKLDVETIDIIRFEGKMMVEHWGKFDSLGMIQQLDASLTNETISNVRSAP